MTVIAIILGVLGIVCAIVEIAGVADEHDPY